MRSSNTLLLLNLFVSIRLLCEPSTGSLIVDTPAGRIQGVIATDGDYDMFLGIPYAKVDINNPFGLSTPHPKFKDIFQADEDLAMCPQHDIYSNTIQGTLDCLRLNLYVPNSANFQNKLPVMVFIPGGAFKRGIAGRYQYGPKYLVKHDVILVILNHRFGPYGFLCLNSTEVPGNQGLNDQVIALQWIKDNIESFGGDPGEITLFGFSTGAISIEYHLIYSDETLFKRAILQSGKSLLSVTSTPDPSVPLKISKHLGMPTNSTSEALIFLATVDPKILIETVNDLKINFGPCVEKYYDAKKNTEARTKTNKPKVKGKSIMLGVNENEAAMYFTKPGDYTPNIFYLSLSNIFKFSNTTLTEMSELVQRFYLGDKKVSEEVRLPLIEFHSDFNIIHPVHRSIKMYLNLEPENIYYYMFSYMGKRNNGQLKFKFTFNGATHGDEVGYLFDPEFMTWKSTPEDQLMIDRITTMWTNFAKYGNPTPEKTELLPVKWTPTSRDQNCFLRIDSNLTMENSLFHQRMAFWDLFYKLNSKYQRIKN